MENKKDNSILIRLSDEEMKKLNDGWFRSVSMAGRPVSKSEYIRSCIGLMGDRLKEMDAAGPMSRLDPNKYDYLNEED